MRTLRNSPILVGIALGPVAFVLGVIGYLQLGNDRTSVVDAAFQSVQLFAMEGGATSGGTPLALNLARFLAPAVVIFTTIVTIATVLRDQVQRGVVGLFAREHVVLVGLSPSNATRATVLRRQGRRPVVVESSPGNPLLPGVRALGVRVIVGDARQAPILHRARTTRAAHVVVCVGEDSANLEIAGRIVQLVTARPRDHDLTVHVAIDHVGLWQELARLELLRPDSRPELEFYNPVDREAQTFVDEVQRLSGHDVLTRVVIDGQGDLVRRTLVHLARRAYLGGTRLRVLLTNVTQREVDGGLLADDAWVTEVADVGRLEDGEGGGFVGLVVSGTDDAAGLSRALRLDEAAVTDETFLLARTDQGRTLLDAAGLRGRLHLVTAWSAASHPDRFLGQAGRELMAQVRHEEYLAGERRRGAADGNPSAVPWSELPEPLKESNRRFVDSLGQTVREMGAVIVPLRSLESDAHDSLNDGLFEALAEKEHERWARDLEADGWRYGPPPKDPDARTHPLLVPWAELPEDEKDKDRESIRAIPRMLARIGFGLATDHDSVAGETGPAR